MLKLQSQRYIPAGARQVKSKKAEAVAYIYEHGGKFIVIAYAFKRSKPEFHFNYSSAEARAKKVELFFKGIECAEAFKAQQKVEALARKSNAGVKVGQVYVSSWGYEQTNVNFYRVVELVGKASVRLVEVGGELLEGSEQSSMSGYCIPSMEPGAKGEAFLAQVSGGSVRSSKIAGRGGASAWCGKPQYWSSYH